MTLSQTSTSPNGNVKKQTVTAPAEPVSRSTCRYLGLPDDKETWLAFPSPGNNCHFVDHPQPVALDHQEAYCLVDNHLHCPALELQKRKRLPDRIAYTSGPGGRRRLFPRLLFSILVLVMVFTIVAIFVFRPTLPVIGQVGNPLSAAAENNTAGSSTPITGTPPPTLANTAVPVNVLSAPELTPTQTLTPTMLPAPAITTALMVTATAVTSTITPTETPTETPTASSTPTSSPTATPTASPAFTPNPPLPQVVVIVPNLNVRSGPGVDYLIIGTIDQGTRFDLIGRTNNGDWYQICCLDGAPSTGWIFSETVTVEGDFLAVPVVTEIPTPPPTTEGP